MSPRKQRTITSGKFIMLCCRCIIAGNREQLKPFLGARIKLAAPHHAEQVATYAAELGVTLHMEDESCQPSQH